MSYSRLEKFIYAICSMDVSDLPVPLSRIETLWNCLITGETPDFEPLSRNENYLMAMLDRYDISNLPAPMSRGEKLLYKIAIGETDLSDVPGYLSRYEELLKYLIENGGISGGDFEYVLYTLNQSMYTLYTTAEKPVKRAILKGQTLVNLIKGELSSNVVGNYTHPTCYISSTTTLLNSKEYTVIFELYDLNVSNGLIKSFYVGYGRNNKTQISNIGNGIHKVLLSNLGVDGKAIYFFSDILDYDDNGSVKIKNIMILEGDYTNVDIPYFEGMQSVKMPVLKATGKNLFDKSFVLGNIDSDGNLIDSNLNIISNMIKVKPNTTYSVVCPGNYIDNKKVYHIHYDKDKKLIKIDISFPFTTQENCNFVRIQINDSSVDIDNLNNSFQLEEGSSATTYEPYKSNILTVNEEVELRGIGDVRDELNLLTGELTQRIGEYSLDGSSNNGKWVIRTDIYMEGYIYFQQELNYILQSKNIAICDLLPYSNQSNISSEQLRLSVYNNETRIGVRLSESKGISSLDEFSEYLKSNPIKFKYPLATASIKTVDLTIVDQDNQPTQLGTFENITRVSLEAENLIPEVEMEVATHISEELASASPLMDDISTEQQQLNTTVDEQSDNVDATMIATTEIFEETL